MHVLYQDPGVLAAGWGWKYNVRCVCVESHRLVKPILVSEWVVLSPVKPAAGELWPLACVGILLSAWAIHVGCTCSIKSEERHLQRVITAGIGCQMLLAVLVATCL